MYSRSLWEKETIIKDAVHGYISIPKPIMRGIVDTRTFQRLKNIEQTGMEALYPSATHNRFTHSLGVYHLAKIAFDQFSKNVRSDFCWLYEKMANRYENKAEYVWDRWRLLFQLAALLHDCGHAPFSHTLEFIYDLKDIDRNLLEELKKGMSEAFKEDLIKPKEHQDESDQGYGAPHERMSAYYIKTAGQGFFRDHVQLLLKDYAEKFLTRSKTIFYDNDKVLMDDDIEFMVRMIIGCRYQLNKAEQYFGYSSREQDKEDWILELQIRNCIIGMLNSKLDVDNLDYVVRDSKYSGYANQSVDLERLLSSFTVVTAYDFERLELGEDDYLDYCINLRQFQGSSIDARISGRCHIWSRHQNVEAFGNVFLHREERREDVKQRSLITAAPFSALVKFESADEGGVEIQSVGGAGCSYLNIRGHMTGTFSGTILTNDSDGIPGHWKETGQKRLYFAYYQNSMSVLMSAIEGSNFEKKWIYAHQTSTFTNNFLNIYLLEKYAQILMEPDLLDYHNEYCRLTLDPEEILEDSSQVGEGNINLLDKIKLLLNDDKLDDMVSDSLDENLPEKILESVLLLYEAAFTVKKTKSEDICDMDLLKQLALRCVKEKKQIKQAYLAVLQEFHERTKRLRGREIQYIWDVLAMCGNEMEFQGHRFSKSDDEDLVAVYKQVYLDYVFNKDNKDKYKNLQMRNMYQEFCDVFEYLLKRKYMRSFWKSYPEYQFYFQDWTKGELDELMKFLEPVSVPIDAGYLVMSDTVGIDRASVNQKIFWCYLKEEFNLKRFVSVKQVIKTKQFLPHETYMKRGSRVVRLEDIGLYNQAQKEVSFLYFYYEKNTEPDDKEEGTDKDYWENDIGADSVKVIEWLRKAIHDKDFLKEQRLKYGVSIAEGESEPKVCSIADLKAREGEKWKRGDLAIMKIKDKLVIRDNVYGNIELTSKVRMLLNCKEFQRLRRITQLATAGQVFPGAVQNRFSHSLGVYHLMNKIVSHFEEKLGQIGYEQYIPQEEKDAILVAALLHDIGHGPFSHVFEKAGINKEEKSHEMWTKQIITSKETDVNKKLIEIWGEKFPEKVMEYIECRRMAKQGIVEPAELEHLNLKLIFSSLVSSQLDADRMDYLLRDSHACGVTYGQFDLDKLIEGMTIALEKDQELRVGVEEDYLPNVEEYFYARYQMYNNVYLHPFKLFTEQLLQRILRVACDLYIKGILTPDAVPPVLGGVFNHAQMSLADFCDLDDHVIMGAIQIWSKLEEGELYLLKYLCQCFLNRDGYKKLILTDTELFCDKFQKESADHIDLRDARNEWNEVIYCLKETDMYHKPQQENSGKLTDVYIVRKNGIIVKMRDIAQRMNMHNKESCIYYSEELMKQFHPDDIELFQNLAKEFDVYRSVEIETKYVINVPDKEQELIDQILQVIKEKGYGVKNTGEVQQTDDYYDTDNFVLAENDYSVRIRDRKGKRFITCKYYVDSSSNGNGWQLERYETERAIKTDQLHENISCIDQATQELLKSQSQGVDNLKKRIQIVNNRCKYNIFKERASQGGKNESYEMVVDRVTYRNLDNEREHSEKQIEIELKSSYETRITMKALTDAAMGVLLPEFLEEISDSKYQRALKFTR